MRRVSQPHKRKLTEIIVRQAKPKAAAYLIWDTHQRGLALRVRPTGRKGWLCIYRAGGKPRWLHLGDADAIGLGDARVHRGRGDARGGQGRRSGQREARQARQRYASASWPRSMSRHAKKHNKSWKQGAYLVERYATARWRDLPANSITRTNVRGMLAKLKPMMANQVLAAISAAFSWGGGRGTRRANPCRLIKRNADAEPRAHPVGVGNSAILACPRRHCRSDHRRRP